MAWKEGYIRVISRFAGQMGVIRQPHKRDLKFHSGLFIGDTTNRYYDGFSDHTVGISAAVCAMSLGAVIIEKHFTFDKALAGPDHKCSISPVELKSLCGFRDDIEIIRR